MIINNLTNISNQTDETDGMDCLKSKAAESIIRALQRQLSVVNFFNDANSDEVNDPLTNVGCEGNFSPVRNDCKRAGGSVTQRKIFKWARNSKQAKEVKRMKNEFYENIEAIEAKKK